MTAPPRIFSPQRRIAARARAQRRARAAGSADFLLADMIDDVAERLRFLRHRATRALVVGDRGGAMAAELTAQGATVTRADPCPAAAAAAINEEAPFADAAYDLIVSLATLDTLNDLPGALIHARRALIPGGLLIASFVGAGSLPRLRAAMLAADGARLAPRLHPQIDVRAGGELLQRCGLADPVADSRTLSVRYATLDALIADLRAQALGNVLAAPGPPLGKAALARARAAFLVAAEAGRVAERFEILTLSGWRR